MTTTPISIAKAEIQEAAQTGATELDLSNLDLESVPVEIGQLNALTRLYLNDNQLHDLPPEIFTLGKLQLLQLSNNLFSCLPADIKQLNNLVELYLDNNIISKLPAEIAHLSSLCTLGLSGNPLTSISEIYLLQNLIDIDIDIRNTGLTTRQISELLQSIKFNSVYLTKEQFNNLPANRRNSIYILDN